MVFYFVQRGETLYTIAKRYQTTVHAIVVANRLEDPNAICPGQALIIPRPGEVPQPPPGGIVHLVRAGETVFQLSVKFGTTVTDILRANQVAHPEFIMPGQQLVIPERMEAGDDWPMVGRTPGRAGAGPIVLEGTPSPGWRYLPGKPTVVQPSAPVVRYDRVYVGLGDGWFYSLCRETGRLKWRLPAASADALSAIREVGHALPAPAVFDGLAYLCGPDGSVFAVDAYTGKRIWRTTTGALITSSPAVSGGVVYLGCWDGHVYAMEAKTGAVAWRRPLGAPLALPVAVGDDQVYAVSTDERLWALDAESGDILWTADVPGAPAPVFAEVVILAGGRAYDPRDGALLWEVAVAGATPVARLDQVIYPGGVVDLFTGHLHAAHVAGVRAPSQEAAQERDGALEPPTTEEMAAARPPVMPPPPMNVRSHVASGDLLIGVAEDQRLHGRCIPGGSVAWTVPLPAPGHHPPAIAPGQMIVSLADGSVQTYRFA